MGSPTPAVPGREITVNGKTLCIHALPLGALERFWPVVTGQWKPEPSERLAFVSKVAELVYEGVRLNHPDITVQVLKDEYITLRNYRDVMLAVLEESGLQPQEKKPGGPPTSP